jgi:hypothetical protein
VRRVAVSKKALVAIVVVVVVVAFIGGLIGASLMSAQQPSGSYAQPRPSYVQQTETVFSGSAAVNPGTYDVIPFTVPSGANNVVLSGTLTASGGSGNDIRVYVFDSTGLTNWENGHQASAYYSTGQETAFNINVQLPSVVVGGGTATYYVVFDNTFSTFSGKTVTGTLTVTYYVPYS